MRWPQSQKFSVVVRSQSALDVTVPSRARKGRLICLTSCMAPAAVEDRKNNRAIQIAGCDLCCPVSSAFPTQLRSRATSEDAHYTQSCPYQSGVAPLSSFRMASSKPTWRIQKTLRSRVEALEPRLDNPGCVSLITSSPPHLPRR